MGSYAPARPDSVHIGAVRHLDNELDIAIIVVVRAARNLHKLIGHADVLCVDAHVLGGCHGDQRNRAFVAKGLVGPAADAADELDRGDAIISHEHTAHSHK